MLFFTLFAVCNGGVGGGNNNGVSCFTTQSVSNSNNGGENEDSASLNKDVVVAAFNSNLSSLYNPKHSVSSSDDIIRCQQSR